MQKHIVIFSHGFGVDKTDRGMFTPIVAALPEVESVLFDYCQHNESDRNMIIRTFAEKAEILRKVIDETKEKNPDAIIDIFAHSQGCIIVALLCPEGIRKTIFTSARDSLDYQDTVARFKKRPGAVINFDGVSTIIRGDGSKTFIPAQYWKDRDTINPIEAYTNLAKVTDLTFITPKQDTMHRQMNFPGFKVMPVDGDHSFEGEAMQGLIKKIREIIL